MQTREAIIKKLKKAGITTYRHMGPYLILGGVATNLYILTAPQQVLATQTCENARSQLDDNASLLAILNAVLVADTGIYVFNVTGAIRAIVIPTMHWAYNKVAEALAEEPHEVATLSTYQLKSLEICENELIQAVSTGMFLSMLPLSRAITLPFLPIAALPLGRIFLKHNLFNYPGSATYQRYHEIYPDRPWLANTLSGIESISTGVNLSGSLNALSYFLINAFYDSSHENDWPYQNLVVNGMTVLGMVAGMASIFNEQAHCASNHASSTIQMFYLICMPLLSMTLCFAPQLENMTTFMQESIYVLLGIAAFSALIAGMHTHLTAKQAADPSRVRVEEMDADDESNEEYVTIPAANSGNSNFEYGTFFDERAITINAGRAAVGEEYDPVRISSSSRSSSFSSSSPGGT